MGHIARETTVEVGGKSYRLSRFSRELSERFLDWADKELGHPLDGIKDYIRDFPPNVQELMVNNALEKARLRRSFQSPEVQSIMATPKGSMKLLALLFQKHHPDLSDSDVAGIYDACCEEHGEAYLLDKIGIVSGQVRDEHEDQKKALEDRGLTPSRSKKK